MIFKSPFPTFKNGFLVKLLLFARAVINYGGIPFELKAKQPNDLTANAILELSQGKGIRAESVTTLISDLTVGKVNDVKS